MLDHGLADDIEDVSEVVDVAQRALGNHWRIGPASIAIAFISGALRVKVDHGIGHIVRIVLVI